MPITMIYEHRCIGCATCVQTCQNDVIRMKKGKAAIVYVEDCSSCMLCEIDCPRSAILVMPP